MAVLKGLASEWKRVGKELCLPDKTLNMIKSECASPMERLRVVVIYWFLKDPNASWRRLVWAFGKAKEFSLTKVADGLKSYAEKLTGQYIGKSTAAEHPSPFLCEQTNCHV